MTGNKVLPVQCDIRDPAAIKAAVDACVTEFGLPHVIVHNAAGNIQTLHWKLGQQAPSFGAILAYLETTV